MKNINTIHDEAMVIATNAYLLKCKKGNIDEIIKLSKEAFLLEKEAAMMLINKKDAEPSRSILFKSAAFLAFDAMEYDECKNMIILALLGEPDLGVIEEMKELFNDMSKIKLKSKKDIYFNNEEIKYRKQTTQTFKREKSEILV